MGWPLLLSNTQLRIILNKPDRNTQTRELLNETKELSVHRLGAFHTLQTVFKTVTKEEPKCIKECNCEVQSSEENGPILPHRMLNSLQLDYTFTLFG